MTVWKLVNVPEATVVKRGLTCALSAPGNKHPSANNDARITVEFFVHADQGEEYRFGRLTVNGLDLQGEAAIRKIWSVKPGDSFPAEYPDFFLAQVKEQGLFDNLGDSRQATAIDRKLHAVDVTLGFHPAPPELRRKRIE